MPFDPITMLNSFSQLFTILESVVFVQLILVLFMCSAIFGSVLLSKTRLINISDDDVKTLSIVICSILFPSMFIGMVVIATDIFVFPYLFETVWVKH